MSPRRPRPGAAEGREAARRLLTGLARGDALEDLARDAYTQHPKDNTFPGEVYLRLGAHALRLAGADIDQPMAQEGLLARHLPEARFKGRENAKARYALLATAATAGGLDVDLLDEVAYWGTDDYWDYPLCATVALIRASAERLGISIANLAGRLAEAHGIDLTGLPDDDTGTAPATIRPLR